MSSIMMPSLDELEKRITSLEAILAGESSNVKARVSHSSSEDVASVEQTVSSLSREIASIEGKYEAIAQFMRMYKDASALINSPAELTLTDQSKLEVLTACSETLRQTCDQLSTIPDLQKHINPEVLQTMQPMMGSLKSIDAVSLDQKALTAQMCERVQSQISSYNSIIQILSQKFVYWDILLSTWEHKLGIEPVVQH
eukprot:TRINITY_DN4749_c0_g1_i2.p1 TRINITY_DN4749_c0_g1~~TRINITY_DN4749_c0_g1_i2.p1  ORF type:complete len:198 (+),score=7.77 TRINITY_DN4749_c0_g1_i2:66-659(+)